MQRPTLAYAPLNMRIMPIARGKRFETPLTEALAETGFGQVGGGGTLQSKEGEIEYCGIDVDLIVEKGAPFVCKFLADRGAPKGSKLIYTYHGQKVELPFGAAEGIAVYLNGTDLPDKVYRQCDINVVIVRSIPLLSCTLCSGDSEALAALQVPVITRPGD